MAVNKVIYGNNVIVDLTDSTVSPDTLLEGETAYDASGSKIVGTAVVLKSSITVTGVLADGNVTATTPKGAVKQFEYKQVQITNPEWRGLPSGYKQVEYIYTTTESSDNVVQIKLTTSPNSSINFKTSFMKSDLRLIDTSSLGTSGNVFIAYADKNGYFGYAYDAYHDRLMVRDSGVHEFKMLIQGGKSTYSIDGVSIGSFSHSKTKETRAGVVFNGYNGSHIPPASTPMYYIKSINLDTNTCFEDFVACYRESDGKIGFYEIVENKFYPASTNNFSHGEEVPQYLDSSYWYLGSLSDLGTYTITATEGTNTKTQDLLIDVVGDYIVEIKIEHYNYGDGSLNKVSKGYNNILRVNGKTVALNTSAYGENSNFNWKARTNMSHSDGEIYLGLAINRAADINIGEIPSDEAVPDSAYKFLDGKGVFLSGFKACAQGINEVSCNITGEKTIVYFFDVGSFTTAIYIGSLNFKIDGSWFSLKEMVDNKLCKPLVVLGSEASNGSYYWGKALNLYDNSSNTDSGNYPNLIVIFQLEEGVTLTGASIYASKSRGSASYKDGLRLFAAYDPEDLRLTIEE